MHNSKTVLGFETQYPMQMSPFIEVPMQMSKKRKRKSWSKKNYSTTQIFHSLELEITKMKPIFEPWEIKLYEVILYNGKET
jgi:hypothetical protein